jgi:hypothetical protein
MNRGLPEIPAHLTAPFSCPSCRGQMKTVRNPSYGIGLARHHYLRVCNRCEHTLFVWESLIAAHPEPAKQPETKPVKRPRLGRKKKDGD